MPNLKLGFRWLVAWHLSSVLTLLFLTQLLEARIFTQWVPNRIVPQVGPGNPSGDFKQMWKGGDRGFRFAELRLNLGNGRLSAWLRDGVVVVLFNSMPRLD